MSYNISFMNNLTNPVNYITGINNITDMWLINLLLLCLWIMIFAGFKNYDTTTAFVGASFIISIISILLWLVGLVYFTSVLIAISLTIGSIIYKYITSN